jgi:hypothetical protein
MSFCQKDFFLLLRGGVHVFDMVVHASRTLSGVISAPLTAVTALMMASE